ncbi:lipocalin family protein [Brevundimonas sp.]|uniref:lipocalin family protein n=1 Tax=Brevundimonas sp. TaxID=1871086 RepID=UPI0025D9C01E|nr:lipocalin family protein [Brevundimonas sp.]
MVHRLLLATSAALLAALIAFGGSPVAGQPLAHDAPSPVVLPEAEGPHLAPIEWWYFAAHLSTTTGEQYGLYFTVFQWRRGGLVAHIAHLAVTDPVRGSHVFEERRVLGGGAARPAAAGAFDFNLGGWTLTGQPGAYQLTADLDGYRFSLSFRDEAALVLHGDDGYVDYGGGLGSYYFSRPRMAAVGEMSRDGGTAAVRGEAWLDRQWGEFTTHLDGGWDWFALQLDDGSSLILYRLLAPDGSSERLDGTLVRPDGSVVSLDADQVSTEATGAWTSPATQVTYPSGWRIAAPAEGADLELVPILAQQEIDARASTGLIYWEGQVSITGTRSGRPVGGMGYVELTGYAGHSAPVSP